MRFGLSRGTGRRGRLASSRRYAVETLESRTLLSGVFTYDGQTLSFTAAAGVQNRVTISTGPGAGHYTIQDSADTIVFSAGMNLLSWTISPDGHTASGSEIGIHDVYVNTSDTLDIVDVQSSDLPLKVQPVGSDELLRIDSLGAPFGAQRITAPIFFDGQFARRTELTVDDTGDPMQRDVTVTDAGIFGLTPSNITFTHATNGSPLDLVAMNITLDSASGGDVTVVAQSPDAPFVGDNIFLNANGHDRVFVEQLTSKSQVIVDELAVGATDDVTLGASSSLFGVSGHVSVNGGAGLATLSIDGSADTNSGNLVIGLDNLGNGVIGPDIASRRITFVPASLQSLTLKTSTGGNHVTYDLPSGTPAAFTARLETGSGNDVVDILSNPANAILQIEGVAGNDQVHLGAAGSSDASALQGQIAIGNSGGADTLSVDGSGVTAPRVVAVSDSTIAGLIAASLSYANLSSLSVTGGVGVEAFNVVPSSTVPITIDGGPFAPLVAPVDMLNVNTSGTTAAALQLSNDTAGNHGAFTFADRMPVAFSRVGAVTPMIIAPPALATIAGSVYSAQTAAALAGVTVFLDENGNGGLDPSEPSAITDASGAFQFAGLAAGTYSVALVPGTFVAAGSSPSVSVAAGQSFGGVTLAAIPAPVGAGPDLSAGVSVLSPASVIGGSKGKLKLRITNAGPAAVSGPVGVELFASKDRTLDPSDAAFTTLSAGTLRLKKGASKTLILPFVFPSSLADGNYFLLASVDPANAIGEIDESNNVAASATAIHIGPAAIDLAGHFGRLPGSLKSGKSATIPLTIQNLGNVAAVGTIDVDVFASADATRDGSDLAIATGVPLKINVKAGKSQNVVIRLPVGASVPAGSYFLIADLNASRSRSESTFANNDVVSASVLNVG